MLGRRHPRSFTLAGAIVFSTGVVLGLLLFAAPASAEEQGVIRDPDSPAGQEYALPLDAGRRVGAGGTRNADGTSPLFGIGIGPPGGGSNAGSGSGGSGGGGTHSTGRGAGGTRSPRPSDSENASGDLSGGGTSSAILPIIAGILIGGGLLGGALRIAMRARTKPA